MKFLELNKKRHATKHFNDKPVDPKDVRTAIEIATLAPSAHNSQPWKFVVVRERNQDLAEIAFGSNQDQVKEAPVTIALFTDTDLTKRSRKIARVAGVKNFSDEQLQFYMQNLPAEFARYSDQQKSDYLALNAGLVAMNLVLALTDQGIGSNIILGFDKSKINEVLEIDERFRPELLITVGYTDEKLELERLLQNPAAPGYRYSRDYFERYHASDPNKEQLIAEGEKRLEALRNIHTDWFKELIRNNFYQKQLHEMLFHHIYLLYVLNHG